MHRTRFPKESVLTPLMLACTMVLVCVIGVYSVLQDRERVMQAASVKLQSQVRLLAEHASNLFDTADLSLLTISSSLNDNGPLENINHAEINTIVNRSTVHMPRLSNLLIFNADGEQVYALVPGRGPHLDSNTGGFFAAHKDNWMEFHVESLHKDSEGNPFLLISRRLTDKQGGFSGVLLAAISPTTFFETHREFDSSELDIILLLDSRNLVMATWPPMVGQDSNSTLSIVDIPYFHSLPFSMLNQGGLRMHRSRYGLAAMYQLHSFPMRMAVAYDMEQALGTWYQRRNISLIMLCSLLFLGALSLYVNLRQRKMRSLAELALNQSEKNYRALAENFPDSIIMLFDMQGKISIADGQGLATAGLSKADIEGKRPEEFLGDELAKLFVSHQQFVLNGRRTTFTAPLRGRVYYAHALPLLNDNGEVEAGMAVFTDVTRRQEYEEALRRAKDAAENASMLKGQFVANISHELRTPISGIMGITDVALSENPPDKWQRYFTLLKNVSDGLLRVINDVLDFSRMEAGKLSLESTPFDLRRLVNETIAPMQLRAEQKNLVLKEVIAPEVPTWVQGDPMRLRQILSNLIDNAVKFTREGNVTVEVSRTTPAQGRAGILFSVQDTGIGIPRSKHRELFESFFQVDGSLSRQQQGSGLGLAICRHLVELMGSSLRVESQPGKGSRFYFTLFLPIHSGKPLTEHPRRPPHPIVTPATDQVSLHVLLAEDNELNQEFLVYFLQEQGHTVTVASNGHEALDALNTTPKKGGESPLPDIILMDVQMPELSGLEATRIIRESDPPLNAIPIVALTAHSMAGDKERFLEQGMDTFVAKPVNKVEMLAALTEAISIASKRGWKTTRD